MMERVYVATVEPFSRIEQVAIAVYSQGHLGLLYRDSNANISLMHMVTTELRNHVPNSHVKIWVVPPHGPAILEMAAMVARLVWKNFGANGLIYRLDSPERFFTISNGRLVAKPGTGLTCAALVLAIFDRALIPLVNYKSWPPPQPEDLNIQTTLIEYIISNNNPPLSHADETLLRSQIGAIRFSPLQVAGASAAPVCPASYAVASANGTVIYAELLKINP